MYDKGVHLLDLNKCNEYEIFNGYHKDLKVFYIYKSMYFLFKSTEFDK